MLHMSTIITLRFLFEWTFKYEKRIANCNPGKVTFYFLYKNLSDYLRKLPGNYVYIISLKVNTCNHMENIQQIEVNWFSSIRMQTKSCVGINFIIITYQYFNFLRIL